MRKEQEETISAFRKAYAPEMKETIVIYGAGINAEAVITACRDYPIVGVVDASKTGGFFCGLPVMSLDEVAEKSIKKLVVIARPSVHGIIYKRIRKWCEENGVAVLDVYGNDIAQKIKNQRQDIPYFHIAYEDLEQEIDRHEVISFDVFDTLLMRKVYEPADVFTLVDRELSGRYPFVFSEERKAAEHELSKECEPTIYQIYEYLAEKHGLLEEDMQYLLSMELDKERRVLCPRARMRYCMEYCIRQGKKVYLLSDMYLPEALLGELLKQYGITGYTELLVSCDYQTTKPDGLFEVLKEKAGGESYLHIGDNKEADYDSPRRHGIDAFLIMPAIRMMESSAYSGVFVQLKSLGSRVMLGMLAAEVFQDPFALYGTNGIPVIADAGEFGYAFIAPLALSFTVWMLNKIKDSKESLLLFSARDGWLIQKIYHQLVDTWELAGLPRDVYLMVSRRALEIVEKGEEKEARESYLDYLREFVLSAYGQIYYFDFMSRGTCQYLLESISGYKMQGIYFQKSDSGIECKDAIQVWAYFEEKSAHDRDLRIFALCDFLECIFTSYAPSFYSFDRDRRCLYEEEKRTGGQIATLREIHSGIFRYCDEFANIIPKIPDDMPANEYCDEMLRYTSSEYSQVHIPELSNFVLDDWLGGDKNTGRDALI